MIKLIDLIFYECNLNPPAISLTDMFHKYNVIEDLSNQYILFSKGYLSFKIIRLFDNIVYYSIFINSR